MLKYAGAAAVTKVFSATPAGRRLYRRLGNVALERMRVADGLPQRYLDRAARLLELVRRHGVLAPGDRVLEVGTGWVHWEATVLALHHDVAVTLFDVVDNRLPGAWRAYLGAYLAHLDPVRDRAALARGRAALAAPDTAGMYAALGMEYVVEPTGSLARFAGDGYALVVSADVLEHVPAAALPGHLAQSRELLRPGGVAIHQIDLVDHFHYFDPAVSPKHFYRYDDATWERWFSGEVQYVNRVQRPRWQELFAEAGLAVVAEDERSAPEVAADPAVDRFAALTDADRACLQLLTVHRRPVAP